MEFHIEEAEEEKVVHYTRGNTLISMRREGASYFYHYDGLGSVRQLTDSEGEVEEEYLYDAFGNLIEGNDHDNPYGFTGKQQFNEPDGLIFLRARYYDPRVGRFVSRDPLGMIDGPNMYLYVHNNPVNYTDPTGMITEEEIMEIEDKIKRGEKLTEEELEKIAKVLKLSEKAVDELYKKVGKKAPGARLFYCAAKKAFCYQELLFQCIVPEEEYLKCDAGHVYCLATGEWPEM
jgi:RHS repeat-associated protein